MKQRKHFVNRLPSLPFRLYLLALLLAAIFLSSLPFFIISLLLLLAHLYSGFYRPFRAELNLTLTTLTLLILPLMLEPSIGELFAALLIIPALPFLGYCLRETAPGQLLRQAKQGITIIGRSLTITLIGVLIAAIILMDRALILATVIVAAYLIGIRLYLAIKSPKTPLTSTTEQVRIIAGNTAQGHFELRNQARVPLHLALNWTYPWAKLEPTQFSLTPGRLVDVDQPTPGSQIVNFHLTPPLVGPQRLEIQARMIDPWGLIETYQILSPVEIMVIPRVKYAEWLAKRYLEGAEEDGTVSLPANPVLVKRLRHDAEFHDIHPYQPGDSLKDINWKHTYKLQQMIVNEFARAQAGGAIIVANLAGENTEQADLIAYNFIISALTFARERLPVVLAAYNQQEVLGVTFPFSSRETLKEAVELVRGFTFVDSQRKFLQPPNLIQLNRAISQLESAEAEPARKLRNILQIEYQAVRQAAREHPATQALMRASHYIPPPALIIAISPLRNHDAEALMVTLDRLMRKGYNILRLEEKEKVI